MDDTNLKLSSLARLWGAIVLMRPKHWVKNCFVLAPLVFTGEFLNTDAVSSTLLAALLFCLASSSSYIVNDLHDIEEDRRHPKKSKTRPLAARIISVPMAYTLLVVLYGTLVWGWFVAPSVMLVITVYLLLNFAYTFVLKYQPVVDIFIVAIGFVLRIYAGGMAISTQISGWMFITTLCLAIFLAAIKRRQELCESSTNARKVLEKYSVSLVDRYAQMSATGALVFYSMFVMSAKPQLVITVPLVLFGLFRYWYIVERLDEGESPTDVLFADWQLQLIVALWVAVCVWTLWPAQG
jgi:decaprenyl-phosphate phosphoribosyltransferase